MKVFSNFDSGSIHVVKADDKNDIQLKIPNDNMSEFYQWFHFRLETEAEQSHTIKLLDLAKSAYPEGWQGYDVLRLTIVKNGSEYRQSSMATR